MSSLILNNIHSETNFAFTLTLNIYVIYDLFAAKKILVHYLQKH